MDSSVIRAIPALAMLLAAVACGGGGSPAAPTATPTPAVAAMPNVAGTWATLIRVSQGVGLMTWDLTQDGTRVSGAVQAGTTNGTRLITGTLAGSLQGDVLFFAITVPPGGYTLDATCGSTVEGLGTVGRFEITGVYSGGANCLGAFNGEFLMTKQ
jgi:hypothetical protein